MVGSLYIYEKKVVAEAVATGAGGMKNYGKRSVRSSKVALAAPMSAEAAAMTDLTA